VCTLVNNREIIDCADRLVDAWAAKLGETGADEGRAGGAGGGEGT